MIVAPSQSWHISIALLLVWVVAATRQCPRSREQHCRGQRASSRGQQLSERPGNQAQQYAIQKCYIPSRHTSISLLLAWVATATRHRLQDSNDTDYKIQKAVCVVSNTWACSTGPIFGIQKWRGYILLIRTLKMIRHWVATDRKTETGSRLKVQAAYFAVIVNQKGSRRDAMGQATQLSGSVWHTSSKKIPYMFS
jgi:hypothetical protein